MTEGRKSVLIGCHNPLMHGLLVLRAWKREYGMWPRWWELIGIFLHDIGIWGRQYLSDDNAKRGHWELGADWSFRIVLKLSRCLNTACVAGELVAGHCPEESGFPESKLSRPDKQSWLVAPMWWLWCNYYVEWHGRGIGVTPSPEWRRLVVENLKRSEPLGSHELYVKNRRES